MPKTGEINAVSGIYRSDCCGVERSIPENHRFPPCSTCRGENATWTLVRAAQTKWRAASPQCRHHLCGM